MNRSSLNRSCVSSVSRIDALSYTTPASPEHAYFPPSDPAPRLNLRSAARTRPAPASPPLPVASPVPAATPARDPRPARSTAVPLPSCLSANSCLVVISFPATFVAMTIVRSMFLHRVSCKFYPVRYSDVFWNVFSLVAVVPPLSHRLGYAKSDEIHSYVDIRISRLPFRFSFSLLRQIPRLRR